MHKKSRSDLRHSCKKHVQKNVTKIKKMNVESERLQCLDAYRQCTRVLCSRFCSCHCSTMERSCKKDLLVSGVSLYGDHRRYWKCLTRRCSSYSKNYINVLKWHFNSTEEWRTSQYCSLMSIVYSGSQSTRHCLQQRTFSIVKEIQHNGLHINSLILLSKNSLYYTVYHSEMLGLINIDCIVSKHKMHIYVILYYF